MKKLLTALLIVLMTCSCNLHLSGNINRYRIENIGGMMVKLDTETGKSWAMTPMGWIAISEVTPTFRIVPSGPSGPGPSGPVIKP